MLERSHTDLGGEGHRIGVGVAELDLQGEWIRSVLKQRAHEVPTDATAAVIGAHFHGRRISVAVVTILIQRGNPDDVTVSSATIVTAYRSGVGPMPWTPRRWVSQYGSGCGSRSWSTAA